MDISRAHRRPANRLPSVIWIFPHGFWRQIPSLQLAEVSDRSNLPGILAKSTSRHSISPIGTNMSIDAGPVRGRGADDTASGSACIDDPIKWPSTCRKTPRSRRSGCRAVPSNVAVPISVCSPMCWVSGSSGPRRFQLASAFAAAFAALTKLATTFDRLRRLAVRIVWLRNAGWTIGRTATFCPR